MQQSDRPLCYAPIAASDIHEFSEQVRDWNFEFTQLKPGRFSAEGVVIDLGVLYIGRADIRQTLTHQGSAPRGMLSVYIPGEGSGAVYAQGQQLAVGDCVTMSEGSSLEGVTHERYVDVALAFDMAACRSQVEALNGGSFGIGSGTTIAAPGINWTQAMLGRLEWLCQYLFENPRTLANESLRSGLADHLLAAMANFNTAPADTDATTRSGRAARRVAVRLARDLIHSKLSEPMRLSDLCRHSQLKVRSLEYGFREVTGLTPVAYIRTLRLNSVRKTLQDVRAARTRSISDIAMDAGFWHLSQFASDYRRFYGETPSETRRRSLARRGAANSR